MQRLIDTIVYSLKTEAFSRFAYGRTFGSNRKKRHYPHPAFDKVVSIHISPASPPTQCFSLEVLHSSNDLGWKTKNPMNESKIHTCQGFAPRSVSLQLELKQLNLLVRNKREPCWNKPESTSLHTAGCRDVNNSTTLVVTKNWIFFFPFLKWTSPKFRSNCSSWVSLLELPLCHDTKNITLPFQSLSIFNVNTL